MTAQLFPHTEGDSVVYDFTLRELRHTAASLAIQPGANIKLLQNRRGHLYGSDVAAVGVAIDALLTRDCGHNVVSKSARAIRSI